MNCFETNEPLMLVVDNFCSQQVILTKNIFDFEKPLKTKPQF